jgi:hypothetical protein
MDDRSTPLSRWAVVRLSQSSRHQRQLLAQAYQHVFPQSRRWLSPVIAAPGNMLGARHSTITRVARGA